MLVKESLLQEESTETELALLTDSYWYQYDSDLKDFNERSYRKMYNFPVQIVKETNNSLANGKSKFITGMKSFSYCRINKPLIEYECYNEKTPEFFEQVEKESPYFKVIMQKRAFNQLSKNPEPENYISPPQQIFKKIKR